MLPVPYCDRRLHDGKLRRTRIFMAVCIVLGYKNKNNTQPDPRLAQAKHSRGAPHLLDPRQTTSCNPCQLTCYDSCLPSEWSSAARPLAAVGQTTTATPVAAARTARAATVTPGNARRVLQGAAPTVVLTVRPARSMLMSQYRRPGMIPTAVVVTGPVANARPARRAVAQPACPLGVSDVRARRDTAGWVLSAW